MSLKKFLFTSESVTEGHPDKVCDQISDAVLDSLLEQDPNSRVACETMVGTDFAHLAGEITSTADVNFEKIARDTIKKIGYTEPGIGFDSATCSVSVSLGLQSIDISQGVTEGEGLHKEQGAGDQGLMFGYACDENEELMPSAIYYAHLLTRKLAESRRDGTLDFLLPDGKSQVTLEFENGVPTRADAIVISTQHRESARQETIREGVMEEVIRKVFPGNLLDAGTKYYVNPTGRFVVGGPAGDAGLTGRKIIVDTYGGWGRHGGGAFSGKDPSKVDRSASYAARYMAKNIVASGLAKECEVQLAYAIGVAEPVSIMVDTFGTTKVDEAKLSQVAFEIFPVKPKSIIDHFDLKRPIYEETAAYGHFGRGKDGFPWEKTDMADELKKALG